MKNTIPTDKRVLLIVRHPVGGIKTWFKYVYKNEFFSDYHFTVVLPENSMDSTSLESDMGSSFEFVECSNESFALLVSVFKTLRSRKFDLIHSHGFTSGACTAILAKIFSLPHLMTAHDVILNTQLQGFKGKLKKYLLSLLFNQLDMVQAVTFDTLNNFNEMLPGVTHPEKRMILNGIDISLYENVTPRNFVTELDLSNKYFLLGFMGRFMSQKGFRYIVDAIDIIVNKDLPGKMPLVIAIGSDGFIREEKEAIAQRNLSEFFYFLPPVENAAPVIFGMDAMLMPSLWEACGLLGMESLISGKALIASNCIGLREVIEGSPAFVVEPANAASLAEAIIQCMQDSRPDEFSSYVDTAKSRFTARNTSEKLLQLYDEMIG